MIKQIQILIIALFISYSINAKSQNNLINGNVQQTSFYCGGARPTKEILDNIAKPQPFPNKTFYVRKGKTNNINNKIIAKFTTDSNGNFSLNLPQGTYSILVEEQAKPIKAQDYTTKFQTVDDKCLQTWWQKPYYLLIVKSKNKPLNFTFKHRCYINNDIPCITYIGPKHA
jgi:hypothetical protein